MSEKCERCGCVGQDRRTLWMACFYDMSELGLPFKEEFLFRADIDSLEKVKEPFVITSSSGKKITLQGGSFISKEELIPRQLYVLRVCKRCRGEWMQSIKDWFHRTPEGVDLDADGRSEQSELGSGVFIRENGATKEITMEEWESRQKHYD